MKKIELTLLVSILKACAEAVPKMIKAGQDEIEIPAEAAEFLRLLLGVHPEPEVSRFYSHELEGLQ